VELLGREDLVLCSDDASKKAFPSLTQANFIYSQQEENDAGNDDFAIWVE
jgi:hypothetical protein